MAKKQQQQVTLSQEYIDSIKNYGKQIRIIEDYAEGVRKIPG